MSKMLIRNIFDQFLLFELSLTTNVTYNIDGTLHPDFYDAGEAEQLKAHEQTHVLWVMSGLFASR